MNDIRLLLLERKAEHKKNIGAYLNANAVTPETQEMARLAAQEHIGAVKEIDHLMKTLGYHE